MGSQGAGLKRHRSNQALATPAVFVDAVVRRFGPLHVDLAANETNHIAPTWLGPGSPIAENALAYDWAKFGEQVSLWCNPPFELIPEFVRRMVWCQSRPSWSLLLTPASTDANWYRECELHGVVLELEDRIQFVGQTQPYPKGLTLTAFGFGMVGHMRWHWDPTVKKAYERKI